MWRCVSVLLLLCAPVCAAQAARWDRLGPDGGRVSALAVAPSDAQVVYAGGAAVYRSPDAGLHWLPTGDLFPSYGPDSFEPRVTGLAVCPTDPDRVLAASPQGLFLTTNGSSWRRAGSITAPISAVSFGHGSLRAVASGPSSIYRSLDGGATWTGAAAPPMAALCEDPHSPNAFFGALKAPDAQGRTLVHSEDGLAWTPLPATDLLPAALRPAPDGTALYAAVPGAGGGVFRVSRDGTAVTRLSDTPSVALALPSGLAGWVFSATDPSCAGAPVYRTLNEGGTWTPLRNSFGGCGLRSFALGADLTPLAGTDGAGVLACDASDIWRPRSTGLAMASVTGAWRREDGGVLLLTAADGLYRSVDDGMSWNRIRTAGRRSIMAVSACRAGLIYFTGSSGLERTEDGGQTWRNLMKSGLPPEADVARILIHPARPDTVFVVLADGSVYRSITSITSWKRILEPFSTPPATVPDIAFAPSEPDTLYTFRPDGLYASEDGGTTWSPRSPGAPADARLAVSPGNSATLYRAVTDGNAVSVAKSADGGATWTPLWQETGAASGGYAATFLEADPRRPGRLLLGTNRGLRVSDNGGLSWRTEPVGPSGAFCVAWAPCGAEEDLLGTDGAGLLRGTPDTAPPPRTSDVVTATAILRLALTTPDPTAEHLAFADRDNDGRITRTDAAIALQTGLGGSG